MRRGTIMKSRGLDIEPTDAPPGSPEKIEVLSRRRRARLELFHPDDATMILRLRADYWSYRERNIAAGMPAGKIAWQG